jgi:hypothetical protein
VAVKLVYGKVDGVKAGCTFVSWIHVRASLIV